jgi:hypothetical protein
VLLLALLLGLHPVARLLLGGASQRMSRLALPEFGVLVAVAAAATGVAATAAPVLPTGRLPLAVGNYVVGLTAVAGAAILTYLRWRPTAPPAVVRRDRRRLAVATPVLLAYAAATIAVPLHLGLTHAVPVGARWWLLALVWAGFAVLAYAGDRLAGGNTVGVLAVSAVVVAGLTAAAVVGLTSGFVLLVVPLLAVLLVFQALWGAALHRLGAPTWLIALVSSLLVAWPIATTLPVTG